MKKRQQKKKTKNTGRFIAEDLKQFLPPVSHMGGPSRSGWMWGNIIKREDQKQELKVT